ncbi:CD1375 family protein [Priestia sp. SB1]
MVMIYVLLVEKGLRTIDQVPANLRPEVERVLLERQNANSEQTSTQSE